jgi:pimeloyl-ACP methyl ester carboxylesterase
MVVVGKIGDNLRMDYTAVGDTTNLAARLLAVAEPGQILVSQDIVKAVEPYFVLQPLAEVSVKGKTLPVRPYRVEGTRGVRSRLEAESERGLTPLVGRSHEIVLLRDRFAESQAGHGQAVFIYGEAGIGKSRLLLEFRRDTEIAGAAWILGRCVSYGRAMAYLPVVDFVRDLLGIKEGDDVETMQEKLANGVHEAGDAVAWTIPFLRALFSFGPGDAVVDAMIPVQRKERTAEAVRDLLLAYAQKRPLVLIVEDLHWIDPHSEDILRLILEGMAAATFMVVLTYRPGYDPTFGERTYFTRITLRALGEAQTAAMIQRVLQGDVPEEASRLVIRKAEGNPLFVEELAKSLVEDGTLELMDEGYRLARPLADAQIPDTIQGVIMARIDRLPEGSKTALQVASVIGREFTARLVERVAALEQGALQTLGELRSVELIYEKARAPELEYMFKHALTHDVAYESLLRQKRRELHRRTGHAIEELYTDRLPEFYEALAWHYVRGEVWPKAIEYLLKGGTKARSHYAYPEATRFFAEAIEIQNRHGGAIEEKVQALEAFADLESLQGRLEAANEAYDRALGVAEEPAGRRRIINKRHRPGEVGRDGARIAYYEHGTGEPTLLLLAPLVYGIATFQAPLELLCQDFRIITIDPRGQGRSDPLPGPYSLLDHAEDVRAVIEATTTPPVVFIGISKTGSLGVHFAAAYPHLVEKLITVGAAPVLPWAPDFPGQVDREYWTQRLAMARAGQYQELFELHIHRVLSEPGCRNLIETRLRLGRATPREVLHNQFYPEAADETRHVLPKLTVPTLVLHGEEDQLFPLEAARYMVGHIAGAQLYIFKGRCHLPVTTATAEFAGVVKRFIRTGRPA